MYEKKMTQPKLSGTHLLFDNRHYIKVKTKKIKAENIRPQPALRYGVRRDDGMIEPAKSATTPKFREDAVALTIAKWKTEDVYNEAIEWLEGTSPEERAESLRKILMLGFGAAQEIPLDGYSRVYVDRIGALLEGVTKFQVTGVSDEGVEELEDFPYTTKTQVFPINDETVFPLIYRDEMLQARDMVYELWSDVDVDRFGLWERVQKMFNWVKADGEVMGEVMAVIQPVYMTSGSTQEYIALVWPKRVTLEDGSEKFVLLMRLSQSNVAYLNAMDVPKPGDVPITVEAKQAPLRLATFAQMKASMRQS